MIANLEDVDSLDDLVVIQSEPITVTVNQD